MSGLWTKCFISEVDRIKFPEIYLRNSKRNSDQKSSLVIILIGLRGVIHINKRKCDREHVFKLFLSIRL